MSNEPGGLPITPSLMSTRVVGGIGAQSVLQTSLADPAISSVGLTTTISACGGDITEFSLWWLGQTIQIVVPASSIWPTVSSDMQLSLNVTPSDQFFPPNSTTTQWRNGSDAVARNEVAISGGSAGDITAAKSLPWVYRLAIITTNNIRQAQIVLQILPIKLSTLYSMTDPESKDLCVISFPVIASPWSSNPDSAMRFPGPLPAFLDRRSDEAKMAGLFPASQLVKKFVSRAMLSGSANPTLEATEINALVTDPTSHPPFRSASVAVWPDIPPDITFSFPDQTVGSQSNSQTREGAESWFEEAESSFVDWAKQNASPITSFAPTEDNSDLEAMAKLIGDSTFVALSEGFHNCKEMMLLHHRIIRYLIENHGFNTVLTESGLPESRMIYDYVQGKEAGEECGKEAGEDMWECGVNKMYGAWKEGRDLIEYMREYNINHNNVLQYYGTDIGGFYQNWKRPLENIMEYLETVDVEYLADLKIKLDPFMESLATNARLNYSEKLSLAQKNELAVILDEAVAHFNENEVSYVSKSNREDFQWARQGMISMQLAENYYRNYDNRKNPESSKFVGLNGRELAMARNSLWVLQQMRKNAKVIWIDHVIHTKTKSQYQDGVWGFFTPAGQILKESLGDNFFVIGMAYGGGKFWKKWQKPEDRFVDSVPLCDNTRSPSLEKSLKKCYANGNFFLPWGNVLKGSKSENWKRTTFSMRENDYFTQMEPDEWNCCIYLDEVAPATQA